MIECDNCCKECNSHFKNLRPSISGCKVSKDLARDIENSEEIIKKILDCKTICFSELHKFEGKTGTFSIFRAKIDGVHIVYAIDSKSKVIIFLRAFKNFSSYSKFLENKKEIRRLAGSAEQMP